MQNLWRGELEKSEAATACAYVCARVTNFSVQFIWPLLPVDVRVALPSSHR